MRCNRGKWLDSCHLIDSNIPAQNFACDFSVFDKLHLPEMLGSFNSILTIQQYTILTTVTNHLLMSSLFFIFLTKSKKYSNRENLRSIYGQRLHEYIR